MSTLTTAGARTRARPPRPAAASTGSVVLRAVLFGAVLVVVAFWWRGTPSSVGATAAGALTAAGELVGLVSSVLVCAQLLLVGRVPWFEHAVGLDRLVAWHRVLGTTVVLLVVTHAALMVVGAALPARATSWWQAVTLLVSEPDMLAAIIGTALFVVVGVSGARLVRRYLSYETWFVVHLTVYLGVYLTFAHQITTGTHFVADPVARATWVLLYVCTAAALVTWRVVLPLTALVRHAPRVSAVVPEAGGMTSVWVSGPDLAERDAHAGQFFLVRFLVRGHVVTAHPYSVSVAPDGQHLRFTIGSLGDHSRAAGELKPGSRVLLEGPFGRFTADRARNRGVLLVAGGAGIGPVRALAEDLVARGHDVVVVHRARSSADLALGHELIDAPLTYLPVVGRRADLGHDPVGPGRLDALVPDVARRDVFVCGPPAMVATVQDAARRAGVPRSAIHHEELSLS